MPELDRPDPPYLQIVKQIRDEITSGRLAEGEKIPSARGICAEYGVAMGTAMKVIGTLRSEGLVQTERGRGTVVNVRGVHHAGHDRTLTVRRTGFIYPPGTHAVDLVGVIVPAPALVADALGMEEGSGVIRRSRTTLSAEDQPLSMSVSWFDGALAGPAPKLLVPERILQGTARYVEECTGRIKSSRERITAAAGYATELESSTLHVPVGSPVMRQRNWYWDTEGAVLEYGESAAGPGLESMFEVTIDGEGAQ
jgi:DNA-binding GntR family transcriptional regulator